MKDLQESIISSTNTGKAKVIANAVDKAMHNYTQILIHRRNFCDAAGTKLENGDFVLWYDEQHTNSSFRVCKIEEVNVSTAEVLVYINDKEFHFFVSLKDCVRIPDIMKFVQQ